jgi:hypothetical protein
MRAVLDAPTSLLGAARRQLTGSRWLYDKLEDEIVLFAKKGSGGKPLAWAAARQGPATVTQLNTFDKVCLITFDGGHPRTIAKAGKPVISQQRLRQELAFLAEAESRLGDEAKALPLRWPRPLGETSCNHMRFFCYEYAQGRSLATLLTRRCRLAAFLKMFASLCDDYIALCARLTDSLGPVREALGRQEALADLLTSVAVDDAPLREKIERGCRRLRAGTWALSCTHGDLALSNAIAISSRHTVLIDWENVSPFGLVAIDLVRLLYDVWRDAGALPARLRDAVMEGARGALCERLERLGFAADEFALLEALYVAEQLQFLESRGDDGGPLMRDYRCRPLEPGKRP